MQRLTIDEILRACHIMRWNMINTSRQQSVAEHQYNVCMIARHLCRELGVPDENVTKAALEHDLDEVRFGDIPSPTKEMLKTKGVDLNSLMGNKPREMSEEESAILKTADVVDAVLFLRDHAVGQQAKEVLNSLYGKLFLMTEKLNFGTNNKSLVSCCFDILRRNL